MKPIVAVFAAFFVFLVTSCAGGPGTVQLDVTVSGAGTEKVVVSHDARTDGPEDPVLIVKSEPSGARVMLDSRFVGRTPVVLDDVKSGEYTVTVSAPGYRSIRHVLRLRDGSRTTIDVTLRLITGYLAIAPFERAVEYSVAGSSIEEPVVELPIGSYLFRARKFGYHDFTRLIGVNDGVTTHVSPVFEPAPLAVTSFRVSRRVLNPQNPGLTGTLGISFEVTAPGVGEIEIRDGTGAPVWTTSVPRFSTWEQASSWRGTDETGNPVADGRYTVVLTVRDDDVVLSRVESIEVDRSAVIAARSVWSVGPGTLYAPTTDTLPRPGTQFGFSAGRHGRSVHAPAFVPLTASVRFGLGRRFELGVLGRIEAEEDEGSNRYGAHMYGLYRFYDAEHRVRVSAAALIAAGYHSTVFSGSEQPDRFASPVGVSALVPVQLGIGPVRLTVGPELTIDPFDRIAGTFAPASATVSARVRAGALLDFGPTVLGASTAIPVRIPGAETQPGPVRSGAELHWLVPGSYLVVSGAVFAVFDRGETPAWGATAGFGVLY